MSNEDAIKNEDADKREILAKALPHRAHQLRVISDDDFSGLNGVFVRILNDELARHPAGTTVGDVFTDEAMTELWDRLLDAHAMIKADPGRFARELLPEILADIKDEELGTKGTRES